MRRILFGLLLIIFGTSCHPDKNYFSFSGKTMGTTYSVTLEGSSDTNYQEWMEEQLILVNQAVNTYDPNSEISNFNAGITEHEFKADLSEDHFFIITRAADRVVQESEGYFDPTVMPLVNYWGFGYTEKKPVLNVDSKSVDSLMLYVGWDKIKYDDKLLSKLHPSTQLDYSALAKGYGVDQLGLRLEREGVENYLVEIGGEVRARGINKKGKPWQLGINRPLKSAGAKEIQLLLPLENTSLATSGNYRIFYETPGGSYAHTINPKTGYPEQSSLLSASVVSKECMFADAYATAFMAMGLEKSMSLVEQLEGVEAIFIYNNGEGGLGEKASTGLKPYLNNEK